VWCHGQKSTFEHKFSHTGSVSYNALLTHDKRGANAPSPTERPGRLRVDESMKVLVLDGNQNQAVASVRSLADAGHTVWVGESAAWSKAGWSRSCRATFRYPAPHHDPHGFIARIADLVRQEPGTLVLPMTEATTLLVSAHRDCLTFAGARLLLPEHSVVLRAFNKEITTQLAASLGVAIPKTVVVCTPDHARRLARSISYPVVLKPRSSEEFSANGTVRTSGRPRYATNIEELEAAYREISSHVSAVLVQEFVPGEGYGYFALMNHGELRAEFAHKRIRDVHPTGSGSAVRTSVLPDMEVRRASLAMLRALRWHGVAMVEFRKKKAEPPVFIEVNGRFWNSLPLACYAGVDFPAMVAHMAEYGDVEGPVSFRVGIRCRWFLGDVRHLIGVWGGPPREFPGTYPKRLDTLLSVLTPVAGTYHDLFQWRDPLPELGDWISFGQRLIKMHSRKNRHG
jgi:predicted ATP-grasp superfamily ATP-dependent carboligase